MPAHPASAQGQSAVAPGDIAITGFSGTKRPDAASLPAGTSPVDETFIAPDGAALKVIDVRDPRGPPEAQVLDAPLKLEIPAEDIGQVYGVAVDDGSPPNIYATATSAYGLNIVTPDTDGDGRPERVKQGQSGAEWMTGQFGSDRGGGPGAVWKINGLTGEATLLADLDAGPAALGNIAFDSVNRQLFVSNLDDGLIYRLDMRGNVLGTYDHGITGRPFLGLPEVPAQPGSTAKITDSSFDTQNPDTWGMTDPARRVRALAVYAGSLFYSVDDPAQVWSLEIGDDGSFDDKPEWELDIQPPPKNAHVADLAFTEAGRMVVAERGTIAPAYDYSRFHQPGGNRVLRYQPESPDNPDTPSRWETTPDEYAIGFPGEHRNAGGGIAIGNAYEKKPGGEYGFGPCGGTLWATGDALRDSQAHSDRLERGGPAAVHGVQASGLSQLKPGAAPPFDTYFADYGGASGKPGPAGQAGDVAVSPDCTKADLAIRTEAIEGQCDLQGTCTFRVSIENAGSKRYEGELAILDTPDGNAPLARSSQDWDCSEAGAGIYNCEHQPLTLEPGSSETLEMTFQMPSPWQPDTYKQCVEIATPGADKDAQAHNNSACAYVPTVQSGGQQAGTGTGQPGRRTGKSGTGPGKTGPGRAGGAAPDLALRMGKPYRTCDKQDNCEFVLRVINVGAAPFTGRLYVRDIVRTRGVQLSYLAQQSRRWNCTPRQKRTWTCNHPRVKLRPGDYRELRLTLAGPPANKAQAYIANCGELQRGRGSQDPNPGNEQACASIPRHKAQTGHKNQNPRLRINNKIAFDADCSLTGNKWICQTTVAVSNIGTETYRDPINFTYESAKGRGAFVYKSKNWKCKPGPGQGNRHNCEHPNTSNLRPGETKTVDLTYNISKSDVPPIPFTSIAKMQYDNDGDGVKETLSDKTTLLMCKSGTGKCPNDLTVEQLSIVVNQECNLGIDNCQFRTDIGNIGSSSFNPSKGLRVTQKIEPDVPVKRINAKPVNSFNCSRLVGEIACDFSLSLKPGEHERIPYEFEIPSKGFKSPALTVCASIPSNIAGNAIPDNDEECATAFVPQPNLLPGSSTRCRRGEDCRFPVFIENGGDRAFTGDVGIRGELSPAVAIEDVNGDSLDCSVKGEKQRAYECMGRNLTIEAGDKAVAWLVVEVPSDFERDEVANSKTLVWPDQEEGDYRPEDDDHTSTIKIVGDKEPEEEPEPDQPAGSPDLSVSVNANNQQCEEGEPCGFTVNVANAGDGTFDGRLNLQDVFSPGSASLVYAGAPPWRCRGSGGNFDCSHPATTLDPGDETALSVTLTPDQGGEGRNCASILWGGERPDVLEVQQTLNRLGFRAGPEDGLMGPKTRAGIRAYQRQNGLPVTGQIDPPLRTALFGGGDGNPANDKDCAQVAVKGAPQPQCTAGRVRNNAGNCVCPRDTRWTGERCAEPRRQCTGGRVRNDAGNCVCPRDTRWTGERCAEPRRDCPQGTRWNGEFCAETGPDQQERNCTGGREPAGPNGECVCTGPNRQWNGEFCAKVEGGDQPRRDRDPQEQLEEKIREGIEDLL